MDAPLAAFRFHGEAKSVAARYEEEVASITHVMQKEPMDSYPDGSLSVIRWSDWDASGHRTTRWKLEKRDTNTFLNARFAVESLIKKARWPLTKSLSWAY